MGKENSLLRNKMQWLTGNLGLIITVMVFLVIIDIAPFESRLLNSVSLRELELTHVLSIVTGLFVIAVFVERVIEVFLIYAREPEKQKIKNSIARATDSNVKAELEQKLAAYSLETGQMAIGMGLVIGILISAAGFRTLNGFTGTDGLINLSDLQKQLFVVTDIIITGVIICGGSAAIDKIAGRFSEYFNLDRNNPGKAATPDPARPQS